MVSLSLKKVDRRTRNSKTEFLVPARLLILADGTHRPVGSRFSDRILRRALVHLKKGDIGSKHPDSYVVSATIRTLTATELFG